MMAQAPPNPMMTQAETNERKFRLTLALRSHKHVCQTIYQLSHRCSLMRSFTNELRDISGSLFRAKKVTDGIVAIRKYMYKLHYNNILNINGDEMLERSDTHCTMPIRCVRYNPIQ